MRVHTGKALIAGVAALALALTACSSSKSSGNKGNSSSSGGSSSSSSSGGGSNTAGTKGTGNFADCGANPNTCNKGTTKPGGTFTYTIEKVITGWNLNNANSNTFDFAEVLDGILPGAFTATPDLKPVVNTDVMTSVTQTNTSPQTLVYKINPNAVWSDGTPIDATDWQYQWDTSDLTRCPKCQPASTSGYDQIQSLTPSDNGKTVTVVMKKPYSDWQSMFGTMYPAHLAKQHGENGTAAGHAASFDWFDKNQPTYSGGPYVITGYVKDTSVTETPNPKWWGAVKPSLSKLIFRIITDQTQEVPALQNNEVQAIYPQPNSDIVTNVSNIQGVNYYLGKGLVWEHLDFNEKNPTLADKALRTALFTVVDRKAIIARTIGQFVQGATPLGSHMYVPGQPGYTDNVTATGQGSGDVTKAKSVLTAAGYTGVGTALKDKTGKAVPAIRCTFTAGNVLRQQTCQLLQGEFKQLGVTLKLAPTDDLGGSLSKGDFDLIIFAWVGTPFVIAGAQQIWELKGGADYGSNNDPNVESLINSAAGETDAAKVQTELNQADVALTADAYVLPLYQKPTFLATYANMVNIRDNATSVGPPYNVQEWGVKAS